MFAHALMHVILFGFMADSPRPAESWSSRSTLPALLTADYLVQVCSVSQNEETPESANQHKAGRENWKKGRMGDQDWTALIRLTPQKLEKQQL